MPTDSESLRVWPGHLNFKIQNLMCSQQTGEPFPLTLPLPRARTPIHNRLPNIPPGILPFLSKLGRTCLPSLLLRAWYHHPSPSLPCWELSHPQLLFSTASGTQTVNPFEALLKPCVASTLVVAFIIFGLDCCCYYP